MHSTKLPTLKLVHVSDAHKQFLLRWRLERKLDLELRKRQDQEHCLAKLADPGAPQDNAIADVLFNTPH